MEMEEDMEVEQVLMAQEVDIDYEYDVARYFDFARQETPAEARRAELWFESAKSYPPSPVVTRLILGLETLLENVHTSPKSNAETANDDNCDIGVGTEPCAMDVNSRGVTFNGYLNGDKLKGKSNASVNPSFSRSSTLMKPTASQLAKQNLKFQNGGSRFQMLHVHNNEKSLCSSSGVESQAPKRQKLDGGHLPKLQKFYCLQLVTDAKGQTNFVHKVPKKDETFDKATVHAKLRLTIPREPDFETAHRAHRIRPNNGSMLEQVTSTHRKFKARPLNRKIFEAPSLPLPTRSTPKLPEFQEFHLKTMERAMQNASAVSSSSHHLNNHDKGLEKPSISTVVENRKGESRRPSTVECPKQDRNTGMQTFKARPLNKKIFSGKGDIGVFWNSKRETTVPMEFNFQTDRRVQQFPPSELFSKLSLTNELQQNNGSPVKLSQPTSLFTKDSKENRSTFFSNKNVR